MQPDAKIAPGYGLVSVRLRNGQTLRGFARSRTSFDLALQDLKGSLHPLSLDAISTVTDETKSLHATGEGSRGRVRERDCIPGRSVPA